MKEDFSIRLKNLLKEKKITQEKLSEMLDNSPITISRWVNGTQFPNNATIKSIAQVLGIRYEYLKGEEDFKTDAEIIEVHQNLSQSEIIDIVNMSCEMLKSFNPDSVKMEYVAKIIALLKFADMSTLDLIYQLLNKIVTKEGEQQIK